MTVVNEYNLYSKVGYFTMDNATSNDRMLSYISRQLKKHHVDWNPVPYRLRCNGHVINLAVQAFLFGKDKDAVEESIRQASQLSQEERSGARLDTAKEWRRLSALGRAHNFVVVMRSSTQRYQEFKKRAGRVIPLDNDTRWNS